MAKYYQGKCRAVRKGNKYSVICDREIVWKRLSKKEAERRAGQMNYRGRK